MKKLIIGMILTGTIAWGCPTKNEDAVKLIAKGREYKELVNNMNTIGIKEFKEKVNKNMIETANLINHVYKEHRDELTKEDEEELINTLDMLALITLKTGMLKEE